MRSRNVPCFHLVSVSTCPLSDPGPLKVQPTGLLGILEHGIQGLHVCSSQSRFWLATIHLRGMTAAMWAARLQDETNFKSVGVIRCNREFTRFDAPDALGQSLQLHATQVDVHATLH